MLKFFNRKKDGIIVDRSLGRLWRKDSTQGTEYFKGILNVRKILSENYPHLSKVLDDHPEVQNVNIVIVRMQPGENPKSPSHKVFRDESKYEDTLIER